MTDKLTKLLNLYKNDATSPEEKRTAAVKIADEILRNPITSPSIVDNSYTERLRRECNIVKRDNIYLCRLLDDTMEASRKTDNKYNELLKKHKHIKIVSIMLVIIGTITQLILLL